MFPDQKEKKRYIKALNRKKRRKIQITINYIKK